MKLKTYGKKLNQLNLFINFDFQVDYNFNKNRVLNRVQIPVPAFIF